MFLTTDHSGLNKFRGPDDENFVLLGPEIDRMVKEAPLKIKERYCCTFHIISILSLSYLYPRLYILKALLTS